MATGKKADGSVNDVPHSAVPYVRGTPGLGVCCTAQLSDLVIDLSSQSVNDLGQHLPKVQAYHVREVV